MWTIHPFHSFFVSHQTTNIGLNDYKLFVCVEIVFCFVSFWFFFFVILLSSSPIISNLTHAHTLIQYIKWLIATDLYHSSLAKLLLAKLNSIRWIWIGKNMWNIYLRFHIVCSMQYNVRICLWNKLENLASYLMNLYVHYRNWICTNCIWMTYVINKQQTLCHLQVSTVAKLFNYSYSCVCDAGLC